MNAELYIEQSPLYHSEGSPGASYNKSQKLVASWFVILSGQGIAHWYPCYEVPVNAVCGGDVSNTVLLNRPVPKSQGVIRLQLDSISMCSPSLEAHILAQIGSSPSMH